MHYTSVDFPASFAQAKLLPIWAAGVLLSACNPGMESGSETDGSSTASTTSVQTTSMPTGMTESTESTGSNTGTESSTGGETTDTSGSSETSEPSESDTTETTTSDSDSETDVATETETETESDSETGVDCEGPACTACGVEPGEPQRLFGLTWNYAMGEPGSGLGLEELRCIVPETGETDLLAAIPGMDWLPVGSHAYNRVTSTLYAIAFANSDNIHRLFAIDTLTGDLLGNPPVEEGLNWSGGLHVRSDQTLVGVTWNPELSQEELRLIEPETGQSTFVAAIPEIAGMYVGLQAYDHETDRIYLLGTAMDEEGTRLFVVDANSGELLGYPLFEGTPGWGALQVRNDGTVVAIAALQPQKYSLVEIDPETAELTEVAEIPEFPPTILDGDTYDDVSDTIVVISGEYRLYQVDATSGELVANPKIDQPHDDKNYNWSGGIHVR